MRILSLVVLGKNDPRVNVKESEQMVAAIRSNGGTVRYLMSGLPVRRDGAVRE